MACFKIIAGIVTAASLALALAAAAQASVIFSGSFLATNGQTNSAQATFTIAGNTLTILLSNTASSATYEPINGLTSVTFALAGATLVHNASGAGVSTPNAILNSTTCDLAGPNNGDNAAACAVASNVGGEFSFDSSFDSAPALGHFSVGSSGMTGSSTFFGGTNLDGPSNPNGPNFGIVPFGTTIGQLAAGLASRPQVNGSVVITLLGVSGLLESNIRDVRFWYGTGFSEGNTSGGCVGAEVGACGEINVPEPSSMWLMLIGLLGLGAFASGRKLSA